MARVSFTPNLERLLAYVFDEQGRPRRHIAIRDCEERSDEAIQAAALDLDCFASGSR